MAAFDESASKKTADTLQDPFLSKICADLDGSNKGSDKASDKVRNKDLTKTKLCTYFLQFKCGLGSNCRFAHSTSEVQSCPNLTKTQLCPNFMKGRCTYQNCTYAHGEAELVKLPSLKKKQCVWFKQGKCRNGANCGFIHDLSEPGAEGEPFKQSQQKPGKNGSEFDYEASTDVPSSLSQVESDITMKSTGPIPQEHLFRMMAGRGSAPLQQQVKSMSLAIGDLQAKLSQVQGRREAASNTPEGHALQKQVDEMQHSIQQLSKQCEAMETQLHVNQQPAPLATQPSFNKTRSNAPVLRQKKPGTNLRSDDVTSTTTLPPPLAKKVRPTTQSSLANKSKGSYQFELKAALFVLIFALMVMLELAQYRSA